MPFSLWPPTRRKLKIIDMAVGPSPWYWKTFPSITSKAGRRYRWSYHGHEGDLAFLPTLAEENSSEAKLGLEIYGRPFAMPDGTLGVWVPTAGQITLCAFDLDSLPPLTEQRLTQLHAANQKSRAPICCDGKPLWQTQFSQSLPEGRHPWIFDPRFLSASLLIVTGVASPGSKGECAIYAVDGASNSITVYPQEWFTAEKFDIGYQWITRVARDPATDRFVGDGIRIGAFELSDDGRHLRKWLSFRG